MRSGRTGAISPNARKSNATIGRMKTKVAVPTLGAGVVVGSAISSSLSDFENNGEGQGPLGSLFVDVALQVHANFFLDYAPVRFFLGIRFLNGLHDHQPRAGN